MIYKYKIIKVIRHSKYVHQSYSYIYYVYNPFTNEILIRTQEGKDGWVSLQDMYLLGYFDGICYANTTPQITYITEQELKEINKNTEPMPDNF